MAISQAASVRSLLGALGARILPIYGNALVLADTVVTYLLHQRVLTIVVWVSVLL